MAKLHTSFEFTGPLGNFSFYRMRGVDRIVMRQKGGPSRKQILSDDSFKNVRLNLAEFSGCAMATRLMRRMFRAFHPLADYNFTGSLNGLFKRIQLLDEVHAWGTRSVKLSAHAKVLNNFSWNREHGLNRVLAVLPGVKLSRRARSAKIKLAPMMPGKNFMPDCAHSYYRLEFTLAVLPDVVYNTEYARYESALPEKSMNAVSAETRWYGVTGAPAETEFTLTHALLPSGNAYTLVLAMGIRYGVRNGEGLIVPVKGAGCAQVIATG